jgi:hypothetical protein
VRRCGDPRAARGSSPDAWRRFEPLDGKIAPAPIFGAERVGQTILGNGSDDDRHGEVDHCPWMGSLEERPLDDELDGIASPSEPQPSAPTRAPRRWRAPRRYTYAQAVTLCEFCKRETPPSASGGGGGREGGCTCARCRCGGPIRSSPLPPPSQLATERAAFPGEHFLCLPCQQKVQFEITEWFGDAKPGRRGTSSLRDLVQEFYAKELDRGAFSKFDPARANDGDVERFFRGYLKAAARNFCKGKAEELSRPLNRAQSIELVPEASHDVTGERDYHRYWLCSQLMAVLASLRKDLLSKGNEQRRRLRTMQFDYLLSHVVEPDYPDIVRHLECSEEAARRKIHALREAIREDFRKRVEDTLDLTGLDPAAREALVDEEIDDLFALFKNDAIGTLAAISVTPQDEMRAPVSEKHSEVTLQRLHHRWSRKNRAHEFDCLKPLLLEPKPHFARAAEQLKCTATACKSKFRRLRRAWRKELRTTLDRNPELANSW